MMINNTQAMLEDDHPTFGLLIVSWGTRKQERDSCPPVLNILRHLPSLNSDDERLNT